MHASTRHKGGCNGGSAKGKVKVTIPEQCFETFWSLEICIGGEGEAEGQI